MTPVRARAFFARLKGKEFRVILGAFIFLALLYSWVNPILESPDAIWHFEYILHLAQGKGFPRYEGEPLPMQQEASQPPLYYLLSMPMKGDFPTSYWPEGALVEDARSGKIHHQSGLILP